MISKLVHKDMLRSLINFFNSLCTIEQETPVQDPNSGEETLTYLASGLMTAIRCYVEPQSQTEIRRPDQTIVERPFTIALQGYFRGIDVEDHARVTTPGTTEIYNILAVRHDDTGTVTFLDCEIVN